MKRTKLVSFGNKKIDKNTMIFNLSSATNCPMKDKCTFGISGKCYAMKAERMYKASLPYRERQHILWNTLNAHSLFNYFLGYVNRRKSYTKYFRINEAGDISTVKDLMKLEYIAEMMYKVKGIKTYTYTHNLSVLSDYIRSGGKLNYLVVNLSVDDMNREVYETRKAVLEGFNTFEAVSKHEIKRGLLTCNGKGCMSTCHLCANNHGRKVQVAIH